MGCNEWFFNNCKKEIGDGGTTSFWEEKWGGLEKCLKESYPRLYRLETKKDCVLKERVCLGELGSECVWSWSRELFEREVSLVREIEDLMRNLVLRKGECDKWVWLGGKEGKYSTREGYRIE